MAWRLGKEKKAEAEYMIYVSKKMDEETLESYQWNESEIDYDGVEYNNYYLLILLDKLPSLRNSLAHGSSYLSPTSVVDFEIVSVIINRIFERVGSLKLNSK